MSMMKKKARSALKDYTRPWEKDEDEDSDLKSALKKRDDVLMDEGVANVQKDKEEKEEVMQGKTNPVPNKKDSGWGKKVAAAIAGTIGAVAGANLQHKENQRKEKAYQAKRKTGNYL